MRNLSVPSGSGLRQPARLTIFVLGSYSSHLWFSSCQNRGTNLLEPCAVRNVRRTATYFSSSADPLPPRWLIHWFKTNQAASTAAPGFQGKTFPLMPSSPAAATNAQRRATSLTCGSASLASLFSN